ncbi:uncharacterized protein LOC135833399 [Planococcus citri]|uniref:uncharacterized protein LOC135833399 n=1 Tax=Planococcus citri TaxID=170843 RepID=UPI0031F9FFE6
MDTISTKRKQLNDKFNKVFNKFSMKDFKEHILDFFETLSWSTIEKAILKFNLSKRMPDIAKILLEYTKDYSDEELQNLYYNLVTLDLVLHNSRRQWTAVLMKQGTNPDRVDERSTDEIAKEFRREGLNVRMNIQLEENILWIVLVLIRRGRHSAPYFIGRHTSRPYLFYSPKNLNPDVLKTLVSGFGYRDHKICKLNGKNISSLVTMLNGQRKAAVKRAETDLVLKNTVADCVRLSQGLDFCQDKVRSVHAHQMLGEESFKLETFTVKADNEWRGLRTVPEAEDVQVNMSLQIKSKNIRQTIDEMITAGIIQQPYPVWVKEFLTSGKNVINMA